MPLSVGDKLGPYEILALVGKGGMGEVYRAHDSRLNREVAIKVSNSQFTERFTREARAIAALNHTNICHLYDVGPDYLVMEYVEGQDLSGPLDFEDAYPIIQQLIDGIEAAHEKNIIHRDLKPANIKITPEGVVKILDFGLAKAMELPASGEANPENSPTLTMGATAAGTILGTAAYMAPEQAKGKAADRRSDIWSFGVILYEVLTGKRLFQGETAIEILGCVLNKDPDISAAPARVHKLLRWCLEKDRKQRLASISDARRLLSEGSGEPTAQSVQTPPTPWHRSWLPWCIAAFFLLVLMPANIIHFRETPPEVRAVNTTLLPPEGGEFDFNIPYALPALSPDGTRIVFGARLKDGKTQLWLRRLDSPVAQPLPGTEGGYFPFWSPDSRWVAFGQDLKLKKIDIQGGPPVALTDLSQPLRGGSWSRAGVIVFSVNTAVDPLLRVSADGGTALRATTLEGDKEQRAHRYPWFLPDGRHFLYTAAQYGDIPVRVGSLDEPGKPGKVVAQAHSNVAYAQGHLLYLHDNTLMAQAFDPDRLETTGEAVPLAEGVPTFLQPSRGAGFTVSPSGLLAYQSGAVADQFTLLWKDRAGKTLGRLGEPTGLIDAIMLSPDGKRAAVDVRDRSGNTDIWIYEVTSGIPARFTFDPASDGRPVWSPDGSTIYFASNRRGQTDLFRKPSNGNGTEELVLSDSQTKNPTSVSPDGKLLLYSGVSAKTRDNIWVLSLTPSPVGGKPEPRVFLQTPVNVSLGQFSPDGHWVLYRSNETGLGEIYAAPFPGPGGKRQISFGGGRSPRWRRDGKEIFYITAAGGEMMAAEVVARNGTLEVGRIQKLFDGVPTARDFPYDVSADGQKFLVLDLGTNLSRPLTLIQNWTAALRK